MVSSVPLVVVVLLSLALALALALPITLPEVDLESCKSPAKNVLKESKFAIQKFVSKKNNIVCKISCD